LSCLVFPQVEGEGEGGGQGVAIAEGESEEISDGVFVMVVMYNNTRSYIDL
jgi:hypothetical protein